MSTDCLIEKETPVIARLQATQDFDGEETMNTVSLVIHRGEEKLTGVATNPKSIITALVGAVSKAVGVEKKVSLSIGEGGELGVFLDGEEIHIKNNKLLVLANAILVLVARD
ncbi:MAG: hypothetical protein GWN64_18635 [Candidatus Thorarchaeota archaeon]|nr:hypothetical protein [Candidatus Thorarchaeota archaeon]